MDALIVKKRWLDLILSNDPDQVKDWEIRGSRTNKRGEILLIESGSGLIVGKTEITGCTGLDYVDFVSHEKHHKIPPAMCGNELPYPNTFAWILKNSKRFEKPIPYKHPQGAVIWVNIPDEIVKGAV